MKNKTLSITTGLILILIAFGVYFFTQKKNNTTSENATATQTLAPTHSPTPTPKIEIPEDWKILNSNKLNISVSYPPDMDTVENEDGSIRFLLLGPTQTRGTEVHDGIIINIESGDYQTDTFKEFVDAEHDEKINDPIVREVTDIEEATIGENKGFKFSTSSLGTFTIYYLPMEEGKFLRISVLLEDPTEKGFKKLVDQMLFSITFLKID